jgi:type I restriction enzyme M protein
MGRSTVHYADSETNNILKRLHNKLRPAGTPVERVEYIIELLLLRIFEAKMKQDDSFNPLRKLFEGEKYRLLFSHLLSLTGDQILAHLNKEVFPFYATILSKAGKVITGNMPTKMQDQLVLMEEVFANSNFTNNVKGGVIAEVIGLVNEIDEARILKTDLLGDAIESALSETGGTKDLGLFRTPDHIRQMMVEIVDPDFTDIIFDPACGTAGFLFDAYEYVIEKAKQTRKFPPEHIANQFYRVGIGGIEYQGRIRKMAAVNLYIRGLNPHNIDQGDSLKMFDPSTDTGSKSIVIANPPFGAERDQPAYPNVWEEYPKESETTILFVKLMFDLLKMKGRCAVVVSEGFLTWGQNSACALRKILLNDANLRAVISLPQGVFVSKSGQGAKTSILYFEKGQQTDFVWYYKIENDGFSMGTNRKDIDGSQIPELLKLFQTVKQGKKPQDTKYSFCISKEQIETLDPRIAERIRKEVSEKSREKNSKKRLKLIEGLNKKLESKKISKKLYDEKVWQFDNVVESQIENEVTKAIEKAHSYHFNLQNYRSSLSSEQIQEWTMALLGVEINNGSKIEKRYQELRKSSIQDALSIIASFDPQDSLQMDIAREYLSKLDKHVLKQYVKLRKLQEVLRKGFQYPQVEIGELIIPKYDKIKKEEFHGDIDVVEKISFGDGKVHFREKRETGMDLYKANVGDLITSKINVHQGAIAISPSDLVCSTHYQVYSINNTSVNTKYLLLALRSAKFLKIVNIEKAGGIKNEAGAEFLSKLKIPLPLIEVQNEIVEKIEKHRQIINGAELLEKGWIPEYSKEGCDLRKLGDIVELQRGYDLPQYEFKEGDFPVMGSNGVIGHHNISKHKGPGVITGRSGTIGKVHYIEKDYWPHNTSLFVKDFKGNNPKFIYYLLQSIDLKSLADSTTAVPSLDRKNAYLLDVYVPSPEIQDEIVKKLDCQMQALEAVRFLKSEAEKRINEILAGIWGE